MSEFELPLRTDLQGQSPYGAPIDLVPVRLNVNENPYPPSESVVAAISAAVGVAAREINRYPDRDVTELRAVLADYLAHASGRQMVLMRSCRNCSVHSAGQERQH